MTTLIFEGSAFFNVTHASIDSPDVVERVLRDGDTQHFAGTKRQNTDPILFREVAERVQGEIGVIDVRDTWVAVNKDVPLSTTLTVRITGSGAALTLPSTDRISTLILYADKNDTGFVGNLNFTGQVDRLCLYVDSKPRGTGPCSTCGNNEEPLRITGMNDGFIRVTRSMCGHNELFAAHQVTRSRMCLRGPGHFTIDDEGIHTDSTMEYTADDKAHHYTIRPEATTKHFPLNPRHVWNVLVAIDCTVDIRTRKVLFPHTLITVNQGASINIHTGYKFDALHINIGDGRSTVQILHPCTINKLLTSDDMYQNSIDTQHGSLLLRSFCITKYGATLDYWDHPIAHIPFKWVPTVLIEDDQVLII